MYTLVNGEKVENLSFIPTGFESWEQSQYYWNNGNLVCEMFNSETGEIELFDNYGNKILDF